MGCTGPKGPPPAAPAGAAGAEPEPAAAEPPVKKPRHSPNPFLRAWAWKREHLPDKHRFHWPFRHKLTPPGAAAPIELTIHQQKFAEQGFASTVWDSSIVLAKLFERWPEQVAGARCLDLSAGCGLVGLALSKLGAAEVVATDLEPNLPLLRKNYEANGCPANVKAHLWGTNTNELTGGGEFEIVTACDVMYIDEAIPDLVKTLEGLCTKKTVLYVAHGRNRTAEGTFLKACEGKFSVEAVPGEELDEVYQCVDVAVLRLRRL